MPAARPGFLDEACAGDPELCAEVEAMLRADEETAAGGTQPVFAGEAPRLEPGTMVGSYRVESLLDAGGMGEVYRARDLRLGRDVAVKVLSEAFVLNPGRRARLEREAKLLAALHHPCIAAIYELEEVEGAPALVLEGGAHGGRPDLQLRSPPQYERSAPGRWTLTDTPPSISLAASASARSDRRSTTTRLWRLRPHRRTRCDRRPRFPRALALSRRTLARVGP